ncbi:uncharacterized protein N7515_001536 [Penicillium bovifimosum]|uniref:Fatty acyl-CoA reductase n=1 Tax=Penicillium bovifimosum TaxID=126998 RepID=A0A9W9H9W9_9EURO|nr:uncharacterized protein N7515_001536 [Penicillium bovifimosum]KAJ5142749.1 hypothetical protein N7515_001536 [Penicillium bovifimosum]
MIWDYYNEKIIFITRGTGFIGTALLCRLVSQSSPERVYVLCRGGTEMAKAKWHDMLPSSMAKALSHDERITVLDGELGNTATMDLSETTLQMLKRTVHVVFYVAATTQLDNSLRELAYSVIEPSLCLTEYVFKFPKLERYVFFSTAYANSHLWKCQKSTDVAVEEKVYPLIPLDSEEDSYRGTLEAWKTLHKMGTSDEYEAHDFPWPCAYAKHLSERLILQKASESNNLDKVLIMRPSVLGPADRYPCPGFATKHGTPSTACAAAYMLHPGRQIRLSTRCQNPNQETTIDEVPIDVVVDRTLVHVALGTTGCVHAVSGVQGRITAEQWWHAFKKERRLPWNAIPTWTSEDWHSPNLHQIAQRYKIIGTSFAFAQDETLRVVEQLGDFEEEGLYLFADRSKPYSLHLRRHHILHHAMQLAKEKKWPACLARLLCRKEVQHPGERDASAHRLIPTFSSRYTPF